MMAQRLTGLFFIQKVIRGAKQDQNPYFDILTFDSHFPFDIICPSPFLFTYCKIIQSLTNTHMLKNKTANNSNYPYTKPSTNHPSHLSGLQREFQQTKREILQQMANEAKPIQLRIKAWLDKFQSVVEVELWRKNRNLYSKVLLIMLNKKALTHPFHKLPPSTSLPMLSLYEVAFDVRQQLERQDRKNQNNSKRGKENDKQNNSCIGNKANIDGALSHHRQKQKYSVQSKVLNRHSQEFTDLQQKGLEKQIGQAVRNSYDFILKNMSKFQNKDEVKGLLQELWNYSVL